MSELQKAYQEAAREVQQAAAKAQLRAIRALNAGDLQSYKQLLANYKQLNDYLIEYGFQKLRDIDNSQKLQKAIHGLRQAANDIREARQRIDRIADAVEQTGKIVQTIEKLIKTAGKLSLPVA